MGFPSGSAVKNPPANAGDAGSIPGSGRSIEEEHGNPLWYSHLENSMDRGSWRATWDHKRVVYNLWIKQQTTKISFYKQTSPVCALHINIKNNSL